MTDRDWVIKKSKTRPKRGFIWNDVYQRGFAILWGSTEAQMRFEFEKYVKYFYPDFSIPENEDMSLSLGKMLGYKDIIMLVFKHEKPGADVVAHEALHFVHDSFEQIKYRPSTSNDEAQAYFLQWVVRRITEETYKPKFFRLKK